MTADATARSFPRPSRLAEILDVLEAAGSDPKLVGPEVTSEVLVTGVAYDSRKVGRGDVFFAIVGEKTDGHLYIEDAVRAGAAAVVVEREHFSETGGDLPEGALAVVVEDTRTAMGVVASHVYGNPSASDLTVVGVTGTNGKTTTTYLIASIFEAAGIPAGVIGTVEVRYGSVSYPASRTTPESADLQRLLAQMVAAGVKACAMEVSSHALALKRVEGCRFAASVFTNLSQDHLDFHRSMREYFEAKAKLFESSRSQAAAVNVSDPWGRELAGRLKIPAVTFGRASDAATLWAENVSVRPDRTSFVLVEGLGKVARRHKVDLPLAGAFQVWNALAAAAAARALGVATDAVVEGLASAPPVPGRFERVDRGQDFLALVDYAHTPDSVRSVLESARSIARGTGGRVIVVVGCGGDRDKAKRPLMGKAAVEGADLAVFTSDNPRSEDPLEIIAQMLEGVEGSRGCGRYLVEPDRRKAIELAVSVARPGDVLVVAGKGHETGQVFKTETVPFDDREVLAQALESAGDPARKPEAQRW